MQEAQEQTSEQATEIDSYVAEPGKDHSAYVRPPVELILTGKHNGYEIANRAYCNLDEKEIRETAAVMTDSITEGLQEQAGMPVFKWRDGKVQD